MTETTVPVSPCALGATMSLFGMGGGYALAPRKYTLDRLLMQNEDTFEKNFSKEIMRNATEAEETALSNIKKAAKAYRSSGDEVFLNEVKPNAQLWGKMVSKVNVDDKFIKEVDRTKSEYKKALKDTSFMELTNKFREAQKIANKNPQNITLNLEMKAVAEELAEAELAIETPRKNYRMARSNFRVAREKAIEQLPDKGKGIAKQWNKVREALSKKANVMYENLANLSKDKNLMQDYNLIKKYLPKARTYSALMSGTLTGILGTIIGIYQINKIKNV